MIDSISIAVRTGSNTEIAVYAGIVSVNEAGAQTDETITRRIHGGHGATPQQAAYAAFCDAVDVIRSYSPTSVMPHVW